MTRFILSNVVSFFLINLLLLSGLVSSNFYNYDKRSNLITELYLIIFNNYMYILLLHILFHNFLFNEEKIIHNCSHLFYYTLAKCIFNL